ncbi:MAG: radical SAM protein [Candidatus Gastranaerophilales bacterium]|nr:radical SAM protein [Candidatus Gastranaerophilales bacterium]
MLFCKRPFENIEIGHYLELYNCCPMWYKEKFTIGSLKEQTLEEVWNSEKVQNLREKILKGDFSLCNLQKCCDYKDLPDLPEEEINAKYSKVMKTLPKFILFDHDRTCNARCVICRDECISNDKNKIKELNKIADEKLIPLCKDAENVYISGSGEIFYSDHSQYLLKKITKLYPKIRYSIVTNGINCTRENIKKLGLQGKIDTLTISIHAATPETYKKIVRAGNFNIILKNLADLKLHREEDKIKLIQIIFIVSAINYKEMPAFARMAKELGMTAVFCEYVPKSDTEMGKQPEEFLIHQPSHPEHKQFLEVLKDPILTLGANCFINPLIWNLKKQVVSLEDMGIG